MIVESGTLEIWKSVRVEENLPFKNRVYLNFEYQPPYSVSPIFIGICDTAVFVVPLFLSTIKYVDISKMSQHRKENKLLTIHFIIIAYFYFI